MATLLFLLTLFVINLAALIHHLRRDGLGHRPGPSSHRPDEFAQARRASRVG